MSSRPSFFYCLSNSSRTDFGESAIEILFTAVFAFMPIYIAVLVFFVSRTQESYEVLDEMWTTGDLLLASVAMAGPIMYVMFKKYKEEGSPGFQFPSNWFFVILIVPILVAASVIFSLAKFRFIPTTSNHDFVRYTSFGTTILLFVLIYLIITVRNMLEKQDASLIMRESTEVFLSRWNK
jgi:hypothetical protein